MTNVKYLNPFIEAAAEVLQSEVGATPRRGTVSLQTSAYTTYQVTVALSLIGMVQGVVLYGLSTDTALRLVSEIMGEPLHELDDLAQSGIAELGNVITGRASIKLAQNGYECNISTPTLVLGEKARVSTLDFQRLAVPLETEHGTIEIHLALRDGVTGTPASG